MSLAQRSPSAAILSSVAGSVKVQNPSGVRRLRWRRVLWILLIPFGCLPTEGGMPAEPIDLSPPDPVSVVPSLPSAVVVGSSHSVRPSADETCLPKELRPDEEMRPWKYVVLHHSATESGSVDSIHEAHKQRLDSQGNPWRGIGYHFVIGNGDGMKDGEIAPTFRWDEQSDGAHAGIAEYNQLGVGICLIGNFEETRPTVAQLRSVKRLVKMLKQEFRIDADRVVSHKHVKSTDCPGANFPVAEIAKVGDEVAQSEARRIDIVQQRP